MGWRESLHDEIPRICPRVSPRVLSERRPAEPKEIVLVVSARVIVCKVVRPRRTAIGTAMRS